MSTQTYLPEETVIQRALEALFGALGPVETARFLTLAQTLPGDSVEWHRQWQATLDHEAFLNDVFRQDKPIE